MSDVFDGLLVCLLGGCVGWSVGVLVPCGFVGWSSILVPSKPLVLNFGVR